MNAPEPVTPDDVGGFIDDESARISFVVDATSGRHATAGLDDADTHSDVTAGADEMVDDQALRRRAPRSPW